MNPFFTTPHSVFKPPFAVAMVIPTGVGASVGGFGGDATVYLNLLASCCDWLITHPNVANAASFQKLPANAWYVEGYWLDAWFKGAVGLASPPRTHQLGVILDSGMEAGMNILQRNTLNAVNTVYGVPIIGVKETTEPLELTIELQPSGASAGQWRNPHSAITPAKELIAAGASAIAIVSKLVEPEESTYSQGIGVDPIGGLEAIISHTLCHAVQVPCANAPVFDWEEAQPRRDGLVAPATAAEFITATFLPCVLTGLMQAPIPIPPAQGFRVEQLSALVVPANSMGGVPVLACLQNKVPIIAVNDNQTVLNLPMGALLEEATIKQLQQQGLFFEVASYLEAAGLLQLLKQGLSLPAIHSRFKD
jgi:hypothetical protein